MLIHASSGEKCAAIVRGLIFDFENVLYDATAWRRWLVRLLGNMGAKADYDALYGAWQREYLVDVHCGRRQYAEAFRAFLASLGFTPGQVDEVQAASRVQQQSLEAGVRPLPGVAAATSQLACSGLLLGVLSDSHEPATQLEETLARLGLGGRFQAVLSSFDLAAAKPDPRCYHAALDALGLAPDEAAFVGHSALHLEGATAVGMRTIAINHEKDSVADMYIDRFAELPGIILRKPAPRSFSKEQRHDRSLA